MKFKQTMGVFRIQNLLTFKGQKGIRTVMMTKSIVITLLILSCLFACKRPQNIALHRPVTSKTIDTPTEITDTMTLKLEAILTIKNDSLLVSKFIDYETKALIDTITPDLEPDETYTQYAAIKGANSIHANDTTLKAITIHKEFYGGATFNPYANYYLIKDQRIIHKGQGQVIRLVHHSPNEYLLTINNYSRMGDHLTYYKMTIDTDTLNLQQVSESHSLHPYILRPKETAQHLKSQWRLEDIIDLSDAQRRQYKASGLEDGTYTTNLPFLKYQIDTLTFDIYYKKTLGDQLEKGVLIQRTDSIVEIPLARIGSDGNEHWSMDSAFINDSTFVTHTVFTSEDPDSNAFFGDSITRSYHYTHHFDLSLIRKDSIRFKNTDVFHSTHNFIGKVNEHVLVYDCIDCKSESTGSIRIYSLDAGVKTELTTLHFDGHYLNNIKLLELQEHACLYVSEAKNSEHVKSHLFTLDTNTPKLHQVVVPQTIELPDSLQLYKKFGITIDKAHHFKSRALLRSSQSGNSYVMTTTYKLVQLAKWQYELQVLDTQLKASY